MDDTLEQFVEEYGDNKNNKYIAHFKGDTMLVEFETHCAVNMAI
ncbi:hypothetical protein [Bacillus sp. J33]|nr:hypothetical protein [Bacillus sp. J33]